MARCEDCIHYKVCDDWAKSVNDEYCARVELHPCDNFINTADVVPKSEEGAECPICYGTGRIGTTDWLTKGISKKQLAEEKAKAIAEHEQYIKTEVAREIFEEIESLLALYTYEDNYGDYISTGLADEFAELKKKYTEEKK